MWADITWTNLGSYWYEENIFFFFLFPTTERGNSQSSHLRLTHGSQVIKMEGHSASLDVEGPYGSIWPIHLGPAIYPLQYHMRENKILSGLISVLLDLFVMPALLINIPSQLCLIKGHFVKSFEVRIFIIINTQYSKIHIFNKLKQKYV